MRFTLTRAPVEGSAVEGEAGPAPRELRQQGDNCRDRGLWAEAARHYRRYLEAEAEDAAIWVQLGHCLKESGAYREADQAYDRALALVDDDYDLFLQKGHLAKLMGNRGLAVSCYLKSLELHADGNDALPELMALGEYDKIQEFASSYPRPRTDLRPILYLDITDLMQYAKVNSSLSGIQRVVTALAKFAAPDSEHALPYDIVLVTPDYEQRVVYAINSLLFIALISQIEEKGGDRVLLDRTIDAIEKSLRLVQPAAGDVFVIAGAFWIYHHYELIANLRLRGVRFGVFIHDLIQIKNPEYVQEGVGEVFLKALIDVLTVANFVLTNSEFVAGEVREFLAQRLNFMIPVHAIPLATELRRQQTQASADVGSDIAEVCREEYVLCVCTLEVRKNHMYLIRVWERLRRELGGAVPNLVLVGKWGWQIDPLHDYVRKSDALNNWLYIFSGITDASLDYLYRHCLFTVFVSWAEGWGLPVGESLAYGKPCVASGVTSIPEVGGELVRYVKPADVEDGYAVIKELLSDRAEIENWTVQVRSEFRPKTWVRFGEEFFARVAELSSAREADAAATNCLLPCGEVLLAGDDDVEHLDKLGRKLVTFRMARVGGWHVIERWGVWTTQRRARLRFRTELDQGEEIKLYLRLEAPPGSEEPRCTLKAGGDPATFDRLDTRPCFYATNGLVSAHGLVEVELVAGGAFGAPDGHAVYLGVSALALCRSADLSARVDLLEKVTLCQLPRPHFAAAPEKPPDAMQ